MILVLLVAGCGPAQEHHPPPEVLAERKNSQGEALSRFVRESDYTTRRVLGPDGSSTTTKYHTKYFLQTGSGPKHELKIFKNPKVLFQDELCYCTNFGAVADSPLWVGAGINPVGIDAPAHAVVVDGRRLISHEEYSLHIVVFDDTHILVHRTLSVALPYSENRFALTNGNRAVVFKNPEELFKVYDVLADKVGDL
jgi:hypothetical protein